MYRNWPYQYTDYSMPFEVNQSLSDSMQSLTHIKRSSGFLSQETGTNTFSLSHAKFQQIFLAIFLAREAFSLFNLQNIFPLIASGVSTDTSTWLLPIDLFRTYSQIEDCIANFSQSKQVFSCSLRESCHEPSQAYFRLPQSLLQTSTKCTHVRNTRPFSNWYASKSTQDKLNWLEMADVIKAGAHSVSTSRL